MARTAALVVVSFLWLARAAGAAVVTDCGDNGAPGQLRQVIAAAAPGETVSIPACTIVLIAGEIPIAKDISIHGVSATASIIDGNAASRIFHVAPSSTAAVSLSRMTLRNGKVIGASGGAILADGAVGGSLTLSDIVISANDATSGGGIAVVAPSNLFLTRVIVTRNRAIGGSGGGVLFGDHATLTNVTISDNLSSIDGGGIVISPRCTICPALDLTDSTISGNRAGRNGGGLGATLMYCNFPETVTNVTFSGNTAATLDSTGVGGGLTISSTILTNVTITGNSAPTGHGGGVASAGSCLMTILLNTIVAGSGPGGGCSGTLPSDGHNISSDDTCNFNGPGDQNSTDPLLGVLAGNGGPTATHALLPGSPAIDAGDDLRCPAVDQRGVLRPQGGPCDVGAYEVGSVLDRIFGHDFESGGLGAWSTAAAGGGDLAVSPAAALGTSGLGLRALVNDTDPLYVEDDTPADEGRYRARFYFDPNGFDPGEAAGHLRTRVFIAFSDLPTRRVAAIVLKGQGGVFSLMGRARLDDNGQTDTGFFDIGDGPHVIEFELKAATSAGASDGSFQLWIDGASRSVLGGLDNSLAAVDFARMGALSVKSGANGAMYWDQFESHRATYIGP
jgi:hypothetical protein